MQVLFGSQCPAYILIDTDAANDPGVITLYFDDGSPQD